MRQGGGKAKGSSFERLVAKELSLWLTAQKDGKQLIRSVLSGGWQGRQKTVTGEGWRQVGDLAPNGPAGEAFRKCFGVECKHHRRIDLLGLWTRSADSASLAGWWRKLESECAPVGVQPMLIFRANGCPIMVMMRYRHHLHAARRYAHFPWINAVVFPFEELLNQDPTGFITPE